MIMFLCILHLSSTITGRLVQLSCTITVRLVQLSCTEYLGLELVFLISESYCFVIHNKFI